ncbi:MAG: hypothetical protein HN590_05485 [Calditrichaeota bacterium]|nr:hypothetical protein [Calditrichota bacterium]
MIKQCSNLLGALLLTILLSAFFAPLFAEEVIDSIAAIVDDEIILESEIAYGINTILLERNLPNPTIGQISEMRQQVLGAYITQKILLSKAIEETLFVDDRTVEKELEHKLGLLINQVGSEDKLIEYFGKPMRQIKREMMDEVRDGMLIDMLKQTKITGVYVRRDEVTTFYNDNLDQLPVQPEQVELSQILFEINPSEEARTEALQKITEARRSIIAGSDFDSLANEISDDPSSNGGRLGFTNRGDLVPSFEEAAYALETGAISDIVETMYGFHIIRLIDRQGERISTQHILIQLAPTEDDRKKTITKAGDIKNRIVGGESFVKLAREFSDDTETASDGGRLELLPVGNLPDEFQFAINSLEIGQISEPFESNFGIHIVRLERKVPEHRMNITDDWNMLEMYATGNKREEVFTEWVESLKKDHYIWTGQ